MGVHLFGRFRVKDFDAFMNVYDSGYDIRKQLGVLVSKILRNPDDPNMLLVWYQYADVSTAKAYVQIASDQLLELSSVMEGGLLPETVESWIGEEV